MLQPPRPPPDTPLTMTFRPPGPVTPRASIPLSPIYPNNLPTPPHSSQGPPKRAFEDDNGSDKSPSPSKRFRGRFQTPLGSSKRQSPPNLSIIVTPFTPKRSLLMAAAPTVNRPVLARVDSLGGAGQGFSTISMNDSPPTSSPLKSSHMSTPSTLPTVLSMKRSNPKRLSLSLNTNSPPPASASDTPTSLVSDATRNTPITPETPRTPSLAMSLPTRPKAISRPSLLTLITQSSASGLGHASKEVPPTPGLGPATAHTRTIRPKIRLRSSSSGTESITDSIEARSARSASLGFPHGTVSSISENSATQFASSSSSSTPGSTYTALSTPPIEEHPENPYANGPIEMFPGVYLGAEDSVFHWKSYAGSSSRVRILNVAQEIDDPFVSGSGTGKGKEKAKINLADHDATPSRPKVEYAHLLWGHGESGLADLPSGATLDQIIHTKPLTGDETKWGFWEAIQWMEEARREQVPILIHCQCGVSRSATLAIAYIMTMAVSGLLSNVLGHLKGMQDTYDMVKAKSSAIGPNVSLVFQLVEYGRNLTSLLTSHPDTVQTSWPRSNDIESEAEWAARRREFDELEIDSEEDKSHLGMEGFEVSPLLMVQVQQTQSQNGLTPREEAERLDEAMKMRKKSKALAPLVTG